MKKLILLTALLFGVTANAEGLTPKEVPTCPTGYFAVRDFWFNGEYVCKTEHEITCRKTESYWGSPPHCLCEEGFDFDGEKKSCPPIDVSSLVDLGPLRSPFKKCSEGYHLERNPLLDSDICGMDIDLYVCVLDKGITNPSENLEKINREEEPVGRAILFSEKGEFIKHFIQFGYSTHMARIKALRICEWEKKAALKEYCKIDMDFF